MSSTLGPVCVIATNSSQLGSFASTLAKDKPWNWVVGLSLMSRSFVGKTCLCIFSRNIAYDAFYDIYFGCAETIDPLSEVARLIDSRVCD